MTDVILFILETYLDVTYWIKHKKRRKFEKENNLPKSIVWHPITKPLLIFFLLFIPVSFILFFFFSKSKNVKTKEKMIEISLILDSEKKQFKKYPKTIKSVIRNNPFRKNLNLDLWGNDFIYTLSKDSLNYTMISLGGDKELNTSDDIIIKSKQ